MNKEKFTLNVEVINDRDSEHAVYIEDFPYGFREVIDQFASSLLNDTGKVMVIGMDGVGKSYVIEQVIHNIDFYLDKADMDEMVFVNLTQLDLNRIENVQGGIEFVLKNIVKGLDIEEKQLCVVTESPDLASLIGLANPDIKIILEASIPTFIELKKLEQMGKSKFWGSWDYIDVNFVHLSKKELIEVLALSLLPANENIKFRKREISLFVTYTLNRIKNLLDKDEDGKEIIKIPAGLWAYAFKKITGVLLFSTDPKLRNRDGNIVYERVMKRVLPEVEEIFSKYLSKLDGVLKKDVPENPFEQIKIMGLFDDDSVVQLEKLLGEDERHDEKSVERIKYSDFTTLKERLGSTVIGQEQAIDALVNGLIVPMAGLNDETKPLRTFLFAGKSGVGKTSLALTLAKELGENELNVIRLDMSEYESAHESAKLFGSPPGYVGHESGGILTKAVKENPNSIILLDEVEKADPKIWDSFLQVFDAGRMTDSSGETVDFTNTIIIMTSNLGIKELSKKTAGFGGFVDTETTEKNNRNVISKAIENFFKPEFINRIDEIVYFNDLKEGDIKSIIKKEIDLVAKRVEKQDLSLTTPSDRIIDKIYEMSDTEKYGAREIQRIIFNNILSPIAKTMITRNPKKDKKTINIDYKESDFVIN